jgi:hypothetical protein
LWPWAENMVRAVVLGRIARGYPLKRPNFGPNLPYPAGTAMEIAAYGLGLGPADLVPLSVYLPLPRIASNQSRRGEQQPGRQHCFSRRRVSCAARGRGRPTQTEYRVWSRWPALDAAGQTCGCGLEADCVRTEDVLGRSTGNRRCDALDLKIDG